MKIFVTGSTGFVGIHLVQKLVNEGHDVYCLTRSLDKFKKTLNIGTPIIGELEEKSVMGFMSSLPNDLDTVIHVAGLVHSFNSQDFFTVNHGGTKLLIRELKHKFKKIKFILVSSEAAVGPATTEKPVIESDDARPVSKYGESKLLAEAELFKSAPSEWIKIVIRPPMVIGPKDDAFKDLFKVVKSRLILVPGMNGKDKQYSFVSVFDLIQTITHSLKEESHQVYFSAYPTPVVYRDICNEIAKVMGIKTIVFVPVPHIVLFLVCSLMKFLNKTTGFNPRITPDKYFEMVPSRWICSSQKSIERLGQSYQYNLAKTIEVTWQDYRGKI